MDVNNKIKIISVNEDKPILTNQLFSSDFLVCSGDTDKFLSNIKTSAPFLDLVVSSPPYNLGKEYEKKVKLKEYLDWQRKIITAIIPLVKDTGSICWQIGNYIDNGETWPLDFEFAPMFKELGLKLRNRIIWTFGHGLHSRRRFSGRYEVILWMTKTDDYKFNLDEVRIKHKYPAKRSFKGPNKGQISSNPLGKNPEDVWDNIPNVKGNHIEKTEHPCQFPVGLVQRLIKALTNKNDLVFDPFAGVFSTGVAAIIEERKFIGCEINDKYVNIGKNRMIDALNGNANFRPHDKPLYDHTKSKLSIEPEEFFQNGSYQEVNE